MSIMQAAAAMAGRAAPSFVGASSNGANGATFTLTYPGGIVAGDVMVIISSSKEAIRNHPVAPVGWTDRSNTNNGFAIYTRVAAGGESGTLSMTSGAQQCGAVLFVTRNTSDTLVDFDFTENDNVVPVAPASVATAAGQLHLIGISGSSINDVAPLVTPAGYTVGAALAGAGGGEAAGYYRALTSSGSTGTQGLDPATLDQKFYTWSVIVGAP